MRGIFLRLALFSAVSGVALLKAPSPAQSADLGGAEQPRYVAPVAVAPSPWSFTFTPYGWLPWMSVDGVVKGRSFEGQADPIQILQKLDWSGLPAWMSYAEARNGPVSLFNDIVYVKLAGSADLAKAVNRGPVTATFGASVQADFEQATVELGGAYQVARWSGANPVSAGSTAFDLLAGARYWYQNVTVSADAATTIGAGGITISGNRAIAKSGGVEWVDPFVGARLRHQMSPGQEIVLRGDVGGFGVGSDFSWQVIATYNWLVCVNNGLTLDGYVGYRALAVDYSQGSGTSRYEFNAIQQGPVLGLTMRF